MDTDNLVKMANQIGDFFETMPDRGEALENIAGHLRRFWAPRMRMTILEHLETTDGHGMREIVVAAITAHRAELWPRG
ncbi:formate dehydrogenase subunit delta [Pandoraea sputorum]|uniref:formate dehydrogenase subunit delta n=1 Tax=Pandoraea sputorum TaxID=93222 RepID=UPI001E4B3904|nr:formate dehydrogenase subunit delta [Pandoraea sputorum]MCE4058629.1 formate dehydrogenase subunit delta [Pandoraea sputorum]